MANIATWFTFEASNRENMNVSFTDKQLKYIAKLVKMGDYQNGSEVVRDALRMHEAYQAKLKDLRLEVLKGTESPISTKSVQDIIKGKRVQYEKRYGKAI